MRRRSSPAQDAGQVRTCPLCEGRGYVWCETDRGDQVWDCYGCDGKGWYRDDDEEDS